MITRIEFDGYRLLDGFTADLKNLNVVIGANAVGKSTLLDGLQLISQSTSFPLNTTFDQHIGAHSVLTAGRSDRQIGWKITIQKPAGANWEQAPIDPNKPLVYEVRLLTDQQGQARPQYEVLRLPKPLPGYNDHYKFLEATPTRRMILDRNKQLVAFDQAQTTSLSVQEPSTVISSNSGAPFPQPVQQESALLLSQIRFFNEFPIPSAARAILASMAFYPGFDVTRTSLLRTKPADIKPVVILSPTGDNLGSVLHEILTRYEYREIAEILRDFLSTAYPSFEEITCETTYGSPAQILVRLREKGTPRGIELWEVSDGMLRFLCLATALLSPLRPPIVAVDEPELGLHPRLIPIVADLIKFAAERTQVMITTHSPDLLERFDISEIAVMARAQEEPKTLWHRPSDRKSLVDMLKTTTTTSLGDLHRNGELEAGA